MGCDSRVQRDHAAHCGLVPLVCNAHPVLSVVIFVTVVVVELIRRIRVIFSSHHHANTWTNVVELVVKVTLLAGSPGLLLLSLPLAALFHSVTDPVAVGALWWLLATLALVLALALVVPHFPALIALDIIFALLFSFII